MSWFHTAPERPGGNRYLNAKIAIFCLGAGIACVGIATNTRWIILVAIGVLFVGFLLRFAPSRTDANE